MTGGQSRFRKAWNALMGIEPVIERAVSTLVDQNPEGAMVVMDKMRKEKSIRAFYKELINAAPNEIKGELILKMVNELKKESKHRRDMITRNNIFIKNRTAKNNAAWRKTKKGYLKIVKSIFKWAIMYAVLYASFYNLQSAISTRGAIEAISDKFKDLNNMKKALKQQQNTWMGYATSWFKKGGIEGMSFLLELANILMIILGVLLEKGVDITTSLSLVCTSIILVVRVATEKRSFSWLGIKNTSGQSPHKITIENVTSKSKSPSKQRRIEHVTSKSNSSSKQRSITR